MAKRVQNTHTAKQPRKHGRVAKSKTTFNKGGSNYTKKYRGQGR
tara:strand:+ start:6696 stop:6827 length:132 start_codon:yes stop_codon:yes gene_type:complete